jgi:DNA gyrase subunit A
VIALNIAENDADLLVVTENGYGKRTAMRDYPVKGRGGLGVKTVQLTEARGQLVGARVVREGHQVDGIRCAGRSTQGVIVMRLRSDDERVSALAPVVESESVAERGATDEPLEAPEQPPSAGAD